MKHLALPVGSFFKYAGPSLTGGSVKGEYVCRKASLHSFVIVGEELYGEFFFTPDIDARIEPIIKAKSE